MADKKVDVSCYSGHRGEESPRSFLLGDKNIEVASITKEWIEEGKSDRVRRRFFRVRGSDGFTYTLCHDEALSAWFLKNH
jgi:hypothetical protein